MLRSSGVDQAQGYLFGRPAPMRGGAPAQPLTAARPAGSRDRARHLQIDPVAIVADAFEAFAAATSPAMLARLQPGHRAADLRHARSWPSAPSPYGGSRGVRAYLPTSRRSGTS